MMAIASGASFAPGGSAFAVLLVATSFLGIGLSIVTPTLNVLAAKLEPQNADRAGLIVNALLGGSAAIAPLLSIAFVSAGRWWGVPLVCAIGMLGLIFAALRESFDEGGAASKAGATTKLPQRVWLFAAFALAYGICEQIDASWAPLYLTHQLGAAAALGSIALTFFWAISTAGRAFFAVASAKAKPTVVFRVLPFVLALSFAVLALLPVHASGAYGVAAFALAGLGISALLPLVLSLSERAMPGVATEATSIVFASYLIGYGIAAFGVGRLRARDRTRRRGARIHHRQVIRRSRVSDRYDVIIIGSGAGGGTLAHRLAPSGKRILLLERGDWLPREPKNWDVSAVYVENRYVSKDFVDR